MIVVNHRYDHLSAKVENATQTDVTGLNWFKIYEDGLTVSDQSWGVDRLIDNKGNSFAHSFLTPFAILMLSFPHRKGKVTFNLPSCIEAGQYLLRVEIIGNSVHLLAWLHL